MVIGTKLRYPAPRRKTKMEKELISTTELIEILTEALSLAADVTESSCSIGLDVLELQDRFNRKEAEIVITTSTNWIRNELLQIYKCRFKS